MEPKQNEFKFSGLRQFGSENISFTATIHSFKEVLSQAEIDAQVKQFDAVVTTAFKATQEREISEKALLVAASQRRTVAIRELDEALKEEMKAAKDGKATEADAIKLSDKLTGGKK